MRSKRTRMGGFLLLAMLAALPAVPLAQDELVLEIEEIPTAQDWPGDCSSWHELYPGFCNYHHQDGHQDNGDGVLSACDYITLDGLDYHVTWVGPTYWLDCDWDGSYDHVMEPIDWWPGDPSCQIWHEVWPIYCQQWHVESWSDVNGNGVVDHCDYIYIVNLETGEFIECHILDVWTNIHVEPSPDPAEGSTWSTVKSLY